MKRDQIQMRDPFIHVQDGRYYLYGTTDPNCWTGPFIGFDAYVSDDLIDFEGPFPIFRPEPGFWGEKNFWAPEMHVIDGQYYLFASFKNDRACRATAILRAPGPLGPFAPFGASRITPETWECLDGTYYSAPDGRHWMVFCHEWVQIGDGAMCAVPLKADLSGPDGPVETLFTASEALWTAQTTHRTSNKTGYVTDGPSMINPGNGQLWMLWSSHTPTGYGIGLSISPTGDIRGPWVHQKEPVFARDGGHGMVFQKPDGTLWLTIHTPNQTPNERPIFLPLCKTADGLKVMP